LHEVVAIGRDAVREHDDAGEGRPAEFLQNRAYGGPKSAARPSRLEVPQRVSRTSNGRCATWPGGR
jgi:hypothetical protein